MLRHIAVSELRVGMYIDEFCGSAIEHALWKYGFLLQSEHDLIRIQNSKITTLWINVCRGVDIDVRPCPSQPDFTNQANECLEKNTHGTTLFDKEILHATKLCARSKAAIETMFRDLRLGRIVHTENISLLVSEISESIMRHPDALISLARLKTSDEYTYMHSVAVCALMVALARQMKLPSAVIHEAGVAGLMHDIGKAAIPITILNKPDTLSEGEFEIMRGHPEAGSHMLDGNKLFTANVLDVCLHHHERFDGTGYPHKLCGSQISLLARMGAICDVYDAITSDRPYKKAWEPSEAIHRMAEWKGHFDEKIFQAFVRCVGIYPVGSIVRLRSGRIGIVSEQNKQSLLTPKVKIIFCTVTQKIIPTTELDLFQLTDIEWITGREAYNDWAFMNLDWRTL